MNEVDQVIETIKNANTTFNSLINVEAFYPRFIMELEKKREPDLKKSILLHYLYVATGEFDKALEIYKLLEETTLEDQLLILEIASIIPIKTDFISRYNTVIPKNDDKKFLPLLEYPSQDIAPCLPSQPTPSPQPKDVTKNDIDKFVNVVNNYISSIKKKTYTVSTDTYRKNMNSILSAIDASNDQDVINYASGEMKKIICTIELSMLSSFIINNSTFRKLISEIKEASLLHYFVNTTLGSKKVASVERLTAYSNLLEIYVNLHQKSEFRESDEYLVVEIVKNNLYKSYNPVPRPWFLIKQIVGDLQKIMQDDALASKHHLQISVCIQSIYRLVTEQNFYDTCVKPVPFGRLAYISRFSWSAELNLCKELTNRMLNFYCKEKKAADYCAINECYQLISPRLNAQQSDWKEPLKKANFYASLFRVKLSTSKEKIKSNVEQIMSNLAHFQQWEDTPKGILKDAILYLSDKFSEDSESLFEVIRLLALIKLYDSKSSFVDLYSNFFEKIKDNADVYRVWQAEWDGINSLGFFNRKTKRNELTTALELIKDAGIPIHSDHSIHLKDHSKQTQKTTATQQKLL